MTKDVGQYLWRGLYDGEQDISARTNILNVRLGHRELVIVGAYRERCIIVTNIHHLWDLRPSQTLPELSAAVTKVDV